MWVLFINVLLIINEIHSYLRGRCLRHDYNLCSCLVCLITQLLCSIFLIFLSFYFPWCWCLNPFISIVIRAWVILGCIERVKVLFWWIKKVCKGIKFHIPLFDSKVNFFGGGNSFEDIVVQQGIEKTKPTLWRRRNRHL